MRTMEQRCLNLGVLQLPPAATLHSAGGRGGARVFSSNRSLDYRALKMAKSALQCRSVRAQGPLPGASITANGAATSSMEIPEARAHLPHGAEPVKVQTQLVLMRHGESMWNDLKLFTGDVDIPLTEKGVMEALAGGKALTALVASKYKRVPVLIRGGYYGNGKTGDENPLRLRDAAANALEHASCQMVPVYADPALNERCYGDLQGLSKDAANREFGEELVQKWRRSHDTRPPNGESLQDTYRRTTAFFQQTIEARLKEGKNILVVAHGNVLRCFITYLSGLSVDEMLALQVVTALPYAYAYDGENFAQHCLLPPLDLDMKTNSSGWDSSTSSAVREGEMDSLI